MTKQEFLNNPKNLNYYNYIKQEYKQTNESLQTYNLQRFITVVFKYMNRQVSNEFLQDYSWLLNEFERLAWYFKNRSSVGRFIDKITWDVQSLISYFPKSYEVIKQTAAGAVKDVKEVVNVGFDVLKFAGIALIIFGVIQITK